MTKSMLILSVSAVLTLCGTCNLNLALASPSNHNTYTPTLHTELKPTPIQPYQIARATFLPDRFEDLGLSDYDSLDTDYNQENCDDYPLSICPEGAECDQCPFDVSKYRVYNCASPYIKSGDSCACPPSVSTDNPNDVCTEYCGSNCIAKMCTPTPSHSNCSLGEEDCDNGCGENTRKCCVPCEHKITSKPANSSIPMRNVLMEMENTRFKSDVFVTPDIMKRTVLAVTAELVRKTVLSTLVPVMT